MAATSRIALILGAGANVGQSVAEAFATKGYNVVLASRSLKEDSSNPKRVTLTADFSDPSSVPGVFSKVSKLFGVAPSVVIYNAAAHSPAENDDPLALNIDNIIRDLNINTASAVAAAQEAVSGFKQLSDDASKTFIYTGNILNIKKIASFISLGLGKTAMAHVIETAAATAAYTDKGFKFYYADQRTAEGGAMYTGLSGPAHAEQYVHLADGKAQEPWHQTFVKDIGYKSFATT